MMFIQIGTDYYCNSCGAMSNDEACRLQHLEWHQRTKDLNGLVQESIKVISEIITTLTEINAKRL